MSNIDGQKTDAFVRLVKDIVRETIGAMQKQLELYYDGIVTKIDANNTFASVNFSEFTMDNLPNKTGEELSVGNAVRVYSTSKTMNGAYIGVKI